jgi:chemotaxis protein histidine kinase CheA
VTQFEKDLLVSEKSLKHEESSLESSVDEMLASEFKRIINNEKVDVFIEELEQLISDLTQQIPGLEKAPDEIENLIEFKLSINFIKLLSEMMQANQLNEFSQAVVGFLDDIVDGNAKMNVDVVRRLSLVVSFYDRYINFVKQSL